MKSIEEYLKRTVVDEDGCLIWQGACSSDGYPRVAHKNGNGKLHRLVCQHYTSIDISGKVVRHACDKPRCIHPRHLLVGTPQDNVADRHGRGRTYIQMRS